MPFSAFTLTRVLTLTLPLPSSTLVVKATGSGAGGSDGLGVAFWVGSADPLSLESGTGALAAGRSPPAAGVGMAPQPTSAELSVRVRSTAAAPAAVDLVAHLVIASSVS